MSLLSISQSVCDEIGIPRPNTVASNTDQLARQLFSLANKELRELSKGRDWPALIREYTFNSVIGQEDYNAPAGFRYLVGGTAFRSTDYWQLRGSLTPQEWQRRKSNLLQEIYHVSFRLYENPKRIRLLPAPLSVDEYVYEYVTSNYAFSSGAVAQAAYVLDDDVSAVDEDLVQLGLMWRLKLAKGLEYAEDRNEYDMAIPREYAKATASDPIRISERPLRANPEITEGFVRSDGYGA